MKKASFIVCLMLLIATCLQAQLTFPPDGGNNKARVEENIGITNVIVDYSRPAVRGREGKIWGELVHIGYKDLGFGTSKAAPWRAGANECTTIEFSTDVMIQGKKLPAGKYGFFIAYDPELCTLIFSKNATSWGSFFYRQADDVLRVTAKPTVLEQSEERLTYQFSNQKENSAVLSLLWEKRAISMEISVDLVETQLASLRRELEMDKGFSSKAYQSAAQWCLDHNVNLTEALGWANVAAANGFPGERNFSTLSTKAQLLEKMGQAEESKKTFQEAISLATDMQIFQYARQLLTKKNVKEALPLFEQNYKKNPDSFISLLGMARGYSASGNFTMAKEFLEKSLPVSGNNRNKENILKWIEIVKQGKDFN